LHPLTVPTPASHLRPHSSITAITLCCFLLPFLQTSAAESATTNSASELHWSLKPVVRPSVPSVHDRKWKPRNPIDNFIFAGLEKVKISPSPEASRRVLIRRLYFDLIGLPPTPEEVEAYEKDKSPYAYEKVVEHLLGSEHYGERWARHWLDVVRFAETHGFEMNQPRPNAWLYRDYVIYAFNHDKPYDRFILEQFAGDVFGEDPATGFLVGGAWDQVKSPDPGLTAAQRADELHDMVSTASSAFLGLTVGCARCHNHKFDPVPQTDYYAIKACLSGVQHGERALRTADQAAREQEADLDRKSIARIESEMERFEPIASTGKIIFINPEPAFGSKQVQTLRAARRANFPEGPARGQKDDPGDLSRMPNFTHGYLAFSNAPNVDVFASEPAVEGKFHLWLSWACAKDVCARDAHLLLDRDGDLTTTNDQVEIARLDQTQFANGDAAPQGKPVWSDFYDGGTWDFSKTSKIILRGGATSVEVSIGTYALVEASPDTDAAASSASGSGLASASPAGPPQFLRSAVNPRRNIERFQPAQAKRLRFTVTRTSDVEPCIDELEIFTAEPVPRNIALASAGTKATASSVFPNSDLHRLEHINDGKYGNSHSWISSEVGKGWVELEFPGEVTINRVVWGRDREEQFADRLALDYRIEVARGSNDWRVVASSQDRIQFKAGRPASTDLTLHNLPKEEATDLKTLLDKRTELQGKIAKLSSGPMVYAGKFDTSPQPTHRLQRGDAMQEREIVQPGVLSAIPISFNLESVGEYGSSKPLTDDQQRRLALARWIANPTNPLPARVMVNRLWQHHFGEGLVSTPSDFGKNGALPNNPALLDWLAAEFVHPDYSFESARAGKAQGTTPTSARPWSFKHIQRLIVTSASYRQSSASRPDGVAKDAASRLLWRFPPQRLEAEPLRDSILAVSGKLNLTPGGPGFSSFETNDNYVRVYNPRKEFGPTEWRRMIYMTKVRMQQDSTFGAFDCPDGGQITPKRIKSTTPLQALNLLNSDFMAQQSGFFAARLEKEAEASVDARVRLAFELAFSRMPAADELKASKRLVADYGLPAFCRAVLNSNEFIFVE
jgi:hypothetical protein